MEQLVMRIANSMIKKFFTKIRNNLILIDVFSIGFFLGYILGYSHFLENKIIYIDLIVHKANVLKDLFLRFHPNPDFLSDIAAFEAAVIAFLIPLSIEIVSKVSERYESEITIRVFEERLSNKFLPYFLMVNIGLAIMLRFFINSTNGSSAFFVISSWIILVLFVWIAIMILLVIRNIKKFVTNKHFIIEELINDAKKSIE